MLATSVHSVTMEQHMGREAVRSEPPSTGYSGIKGADGLVIKCRENVQAEMVSRAD